MSQGVSLALRLPRLAHHGHGPARMYASTSEAVVKRGNRTSLPQIHPLRYPWQPELTGRRKKKKQKIIRMQPPNAGSRLIIMDISRKVGKGLDVFKKVTRWVQRRWRSGGIYLPEPTSTGIVGYTRLILEARVKILQDIACLKLAQGLTLTRDCGGPRAISPELEREILKLFQIRKEPRYWDDAHLNMELMRLLATTAPSYRRLLSKLGISAYYREKPAPVFHIHPRLQQSRNPKLLQLQKALAIPAPEDKPPRTVEEVLPEANALVQRAAVLMAQAGLLMLEDGINMWQLTWERVTRILNHCKRRRWIKTD